MKKLRIGVLGGTRGLDFMNRVLNGHPKAEVTAICENHPGMKAKIESETAGTGMRVFSEFDEMLSDGLDAVIIANFANAHAPYAIRALKAGVNVFSESIPTQTMGEAVALAEAVEESGKLYCYGENYCYLPHVFAMRRFLEEGQMGEVMHAEGNFINDCSWKWHLLTRGDRNHWRNHVPSTFYCTHSVGPVLYATGRRAVNVVAMETQRMPYMAQGGARSGSAAMEIMQLDNGGMAKSTNGNYRRQYSADYRFICENGTVESDLYQFGRVRVLHPAGNGSYSLKEWDAPYVFDAFPVWSERDPAFLPPFEAADVYLINCFVESILGNPDAQEYMIDVYRALDMSMVGTLGYRSILEGSKPYVIPDMRLKSQRDLWRGDNKSTDGAISAGDDLLPPNRDGFPDVADEVYEKVAKEFRDTPITSGSH